MIGARRGVEEGVSGPAALRRELDRFGSGQVRRLDLYTTVSKALGNGWTLRIYDENPISYNNVSHKWFVPLDAQLVKRARKDLEFAFGAAYGLVRDDPRYLTQAYARVSLYF